MTGKPRVPRAQCTLAEPTIFWLYLQCTRPGRRHTGNSIPPQPRTRIARTAGVPLKRPIAGVAMGLILETDGRFCVLTDILGSEDALGDMDFKVAGDADGVTAFQMDIKARGGVCGLRVPSSCSPGHFPIRFAGGHGSALQMDTKFCAGFGWWPAVGAPSRHRFIRS